MLGGLSGIDSVKQTGGGEGWREIGEGNQAGGIELANFPPEEQLEIKGTLNLAYVNSDDDDVTHTRHLPVQASTRLTSVTTTGSNSQTDSQMYVVRL